MLIKLIGALVGVTCLLAGNAWAFNEDVAEREAAFKLWDAKATLCARSSGDSYAVCMIKVAPTETLAVEQATTALHVFCPRSTDAYGPDHCDETRTYIKQRWGY